MAELNFPRFESDTAGRRRFLEAAAALFMAGLLMVAVQLSCGAYAADFTNHPDESGQLVTSLMVRDYVSAPVHTDPMAWGIRYYLHYPKIGLGRWPPGFAILETLWWLVLPPSRWSVILLQLVTVLSSAGLLFRLLRPSGYFLAVAGCCLMVCSPAVVNSYTTGMADAPCLLFAVLVLGASVRILQEPSGRNFAWAGLWMLCAIGVKGTGVGLVPVPVLALLLSGNWRWLRQKWVLFCAASGLLAAGAALLLVPGKILGTLHSLGGIGAGMMPWTVYMLPRQVGWGVCALVTAGVLAVLVLRRASPPTAAVAAAAVLSIVTTSYFVRAMNERRHWIIVIPALILLAVEFLRSMGGMRHARVAAGLAALVLFPFQRPPAGTREFQDFLSQVHRPSRMLVSSNGDGEGAWIAAVALAEQRPASTVLRATKVLADMDWNGYQYKVLAGSAAEAALLLDQYRVDTVVLYTVPNRAFPPHFELAAGAVRDNPEWRLCASRGRFAAWCRALPPTVARKRLSVNLTRGIGRVIEEE